MASAGKTALRVLGALALSLVLSLAFAYVGLQMGLGTFNSPLTRVLRRLVGNALAFRLLPVQLGVVSGLPAALIATFVAGLRRWPQWITVTLWTAAWTAVGTLIVLVVFRFGP